MIKNKQERSVQILYYIKYIEYDVYIKKILMVRFVRRIVRSFKFKILAKFLMDDINETYNACDVGVPHQAA